MKFQPIKQFNTILQQEYLEPTLSWSVRVVLALNVPLIILPLIYGLRLEIVWAAFAGYMLTLVDYRGPHYRKMLIQFTEAVLVCIAGFLGLTFGNSIWLSVSGMAVIGFLAAIIRNWSNYGSSIGVGVGFFYLFGLSTPVDSIHEAWNYIGFLWIGAVWAILIIFLSFPFSAANPLRRSIAQIWKANTDYLDSLVEHFTENDQTTDSIELTSKELAIRTAIDQSIESFSRRQNTAKQAAVHYDQMMEIRKSSALFGATLKVMHHEIAILQNSGASTKRYSVVYKTISALSQVSARISILIFTLRAEDLTLAKSRHQRFQVALSILEQTIQENTFGETEQMALEQLLDIFKTADNLLLQSLQQIEDKLGFSKSDYLENYKLSFNQFITGLRPKVWMEYLHEMFNVNSQQFNYAVRVALGMAFSVFLFKFFEINHGHWIALTMLIVIQPYYGATRKKGLERIIGTVAGIVVGGFIMVIPIPQHYFTYFLIFISFFVAYYIRNNYKVGVFFVTIMMVIMMQLSQQASWDLIGWRVLSTCIGAVLALGISIAFWPIWEDKRFPHLHKKALRQNAIYLHQVFDQRHLPVHSATWYKQRRVTEAANNDVFACVQRMYEEPKSVRKDVDSSFSQVGATIRLTREITSLGFTLQSTDIESVSTEFQEITLLIAGILNALAENNRESASIQIHELKRVMKNQKLKATDDLKTLKVELEKILFELETIRELKEN